MPSQDAEAASAAQVSATSATVRRTYIPVRYTSSRRRSQRLECMTRPNLRAARERALPQAPARPGSLRPWVRAQGLAGRAQLKATKAAKTTKSCRGAGSAALRWCPFHAHACDTVEPRFARNWIPVDLVPQLERPTEFAGTRRRGTGRAGLPVRVAEAGAVRGARTGTGRESALSLALGHVP